MVKTLASLEKAMSLVEEIRDLAEVVCEDGQEFAQSVLERTESIADWVEENKTATDAQIEALENMLDGMEAWRRN